MCVSALFAEKLSADAFCKTETNLILNRFFSTYARLANQQLYIGAANQFGTDGVSETLQVVDSVQKP